MYDILVNCIFTCTSILLDIFSNFVIKSGIAFFISYLAVSSLAVCFSVNNDWKSLTPSLAEYQVWYELSNSSLKLLNFDSALTPQCVKYVMHFLEQSLGGGTNDFDT